MVHWRNLTMVISGVCLLSSHPSLFWRKENLRSSCPRSLPTSLPQTSIPFRTCKITVRIMCCNNVSKTGSRGNRGLPNWEITKHRLQGWRVWFNRSKGGLEMYISWKFFRWFWCTTKFESKWNKAYLYLVIFFFLPLLVLFLIVAKYT